MVLNGHIANVYRYMSYVVLTVLEVGIVCWYLFENQCEKLCVSVSVFSTKNTLMKLADRWKGIEKAFWHACDRKTRIANCISHVVLTREHCAFSSEFMLFSDKWVLKNGWNLQQSKLYKLVSIFEHDSFTVYHSQQWMNRNTHTHNIVSQNQV